jgi:hypothetical protein
VIQHEACILCGAVGRVIYLLFAVRDARDIERISVATECSNPDCPGT